MTKKKVLSFLPYLLVIGFLFYSRGSSIINNFSLEGSDIKSSKTTQYMTSNGNSNLAFPPEGNSITIFWHSQCGPCKVEMKRLKNSVKNEKIDSSRIFAINPFEPDTEIMKFIRKNKYPFRFIKDNGISKLLNVEVTPTTVFIKDNKIDSVSTGMSMIGIWLAEYFI